MKEDNIDFQEMQNRFQPFYDSQLRVHSGIFAQKPSFKFLVKEYGKMKRVYFKMFAMAFLLDK
jgi:hypothetical protein